MSLFELVMIYAVSWWLVLFMVLPWGVRMAEKPAVGHAASAPVRPQIRRKLLITSAIALVVPLLAFGISEARAASGIYTTKSDGQGSECIPVEAAADASVHATDTDATLGGAANGDAGVVPTYLQGVGSDYTDNNQIDRLGNSVVSVGIAETDTKTGEVRINGTTVGSHADSRPSHCK